MSSGGRRRVGGVPKLWEGASLHQDHRELEKALPIHPSWVVVSGLTWPRPLSGPRFGALNPT